MEYVGMYDEHAKEMFEKLQGSDSDYLLICRDNISGQEHGWNRVPNEPYWVTIDQAIAWNFEHGWRKLEFYDLYAPFEKSMIRGASKTSIPSIMLGDVINLSTLK